MQKCKQFQSISLIQVRNHGESPHSDEFTYPVIANDVMHFMRKHSIEKGVMLGHSLGNFQLQTCFFYSTPRIGGDAFRF